MHAQNFQKGFWGGDTANSRYPTPYLSAPYSKLPDPPLHKVEALGEVGSVKWHMGRGQ